VKSLQRILGTTVIALLYSFVISISYVGHSANAIESVDNFPSDQGTYITVASQTLFGHTPQSEITIGSQDVPVSTFKNSFGGFATNVKSSEPFVATEFHQYRLFYRNCLIRTRKSDAIFPFHYHW
jgi:hypothetical protein